MSVLSRLILCSALTATIFYVYYLKRRKNLRLVYSEEQRVSIVAEDCLPSDCVPATVEANRTEVLKATIMVDSTNLIESYQAVNCSLTPSSDYASEEIDSAISVETTLEPMYQEINSGTYNTAPSFNRSSVSSGSGSDHALTPDTNGTSSSPEPTVPCNLPLGCFNDPQNDIYEDAPEEMNGTVLPKVLIPSDMWAKAVDGDIWHETFCIPAHMGGVLIGRLGKNVRELKNIWQAEFCLNTCPGSQDTLIFRLSCPIKNKDEVLRWVSRRFRMRPSKTTIGNPNLLKRYLPLGEIVPVYIRSLYASKEFFVTIQDESYKEYLNMQSELDADYNKTIEFRMQLCEPVTSGTVAVVSHSHGFARALILCVYPTSPKTVIYYLLDHGTFGVAPLNKLRKIRAKYMRIPFQAIHVSWAHAFPVFSDIPDIHVLRTFFPDGRANAFAARMETCCRASVVFSQPYPYPYSANGLLDTLMTACTSGLFMAVPSVIFPNRQSWLNGTSIPYYPFTYSAIDYSSLVTFAFEEESNVDGGKQYNSDECTNSNIQQNQSVVRGGFSNRRNPNWRRRAGFSRGSTRSPSMLGQKENNSNTRAQPFGVINGIQTKNQSTNSDLPEQSRKPLTVRNFRYNGVGASRGSSLMQRGRGR